LFKPSQHAIWVSSIVKEETSKQPTKLGTIYRNVNKAGQWSEYKIVAFDQDKMFEMKLNDNNYHVRYILKLVDNKSCELEYFEWVETGNLAEPFTQKILEKLKTIIEDK